MREHFFTLDLPISGNFQQLWFLWQKSPPPRMKGSILHWIYPFQAISSNFGFCGRRAPPPNEENIFTLDLSISGNFQQLWFLWQKRPPPPPGWGEIFTLDLSISGNFQQLWFLWQKSSPPHSPRLGYIFLHWIYPFQAISSNFGFCVRKAPPPQDEEKIFTLDLSISGNFQQLWFLCQKSTPPPKDEGKFFTLDLSISGNFQQLWFLWQKGSPHSPGWGNIFYTGSIHFRQFPATLVFVSEKPPPPRMTGSFLHWIYPFQAIYSNFGFCVRKAPPPMREKFLHWIYPFQAISSNFGFCGKKAPPPGWGEIFYTGSIHFRQFPSNFGFCGRKAPPSQDEGKFFTLDLSISGNFQQLSFLWQKSSPPTPPDEGTFFYTGSTHFRQFPATLVFVAEKPPPPPRMRGNFLHWIYPFQAIFQQLWFLWQKSPPPDEGKFFTLDLSISGQFPATWFLWQKSSPPLPQMREHFFTLDLPISGNFQQLWFLWQKSPPPQDEGEVFYTGSIHFRQFPATLVFVSEKPPHPGWQEKILHWIYPFQAISSNFGFCGRRHPPNEEKNFYTGSIHFRQFPATLVFVAEKTPPPGWGEIFYTGSIHFRQFPATLVFVAEKLPPTPPGLGYFFYNWIYPFQAISSNFGFCVRKAPPMRKKFYTGSIHFRQFQHFGFVSEKPPPMREIFYTGSIHFRQFPATLVLWQKSSPHSPRWGNIFLHWIYPFQAISSNFGFVSEKPPPPGWGEVFLHWIYPFQAISSNFGFVAEDTPPPMRKIFLHWIYPFQAISSNFGFVAEKTPPPGWGKFFTLDLSISGNFQQLGFCGRKAPPHSPRLGYFFYTGSTHFRQFPATLVFVSEKPPPHEEKNFTLDLSISGNFQQLWFLCQKSPPQWGKNFYTGSIHFRQFPATLVFVAEKLHLPPPGWGEFFYTGSIHFRQFQQLWFLCQKSPPPQDDRKFFTLDLSISGNFQQLWFLCQKSPPRPPPGWGKNFYTGSIHFRQFPATLVFVAEKPPPQDEGKFFTMDLSNFRQFPATLVFVAEKPPPSQDEGKFFTLDLSISGNFQQLWFLWQKSSPPPTPQMREHFFTLDLPISGNFQQLWFLWQNSPPPRMRGEFFTLDLSISGNFQQLWFLWQKKLPPPLPQMREHFLHWIYPFQAISSNFGFCGRIASPPQDEGKFFTLDLSISGNFQQLWFLCQKSPPPTPMTGKILHWIYPFQAISSNFGFCGRKTPTPPWRGEIFYTGSIHFRQFPATLGFVAEKTPPPQDQGKFFTLDLSISGNFQQLWFLWQKSFPPHSPRLGYIFLHWIYPFQAISSNFGFCGRKAPPPRMRGNFLHWIYPFQAISSNFGFCGQKSPPPPPRMTGSFLHWIYPFQAIYSNFGFCVRKAPPPQGWGKNFYTGSIHFRQFPATLVFVAKKPPPQDEGKFLHWIYPFQAISSNFGFCGGKAPPPPRMRGNFLHWIYPFQAISSNFGFCGRKAPPHSPRWGNIFLHWIYPFQAISSNFGFCGRKAPPPRMRGNFLHWIYPFQAISSNFGFVAEKPPPQDEGKFFTLDLSISGNFQQLWFLWQKSSPHSPRMRGNIFLHWIYPFQAISSNFGFCGRKAPPQDEGKFFTLDLSISGNFQQLWFLCQKSPPPPNEGKKFYTGSIHFRQFPATLVFVAERHPPGWGKKFLYWIYPFQAISSNFGFCGRKDPPPQDEGKFFTLDLSISGNFQQLWFLWQKSSPHSSQD